MKKIFYITLSICLVPLLARAQKQITQIDNVVDRQALHVTYKSQVGNRLIFSAFSPGNGTELWVSEGTKATTNLLKDITPGFLGTYCRDFTSFGGQVYFAANENEIWKTDGTPAGTKRVIRSDSAVGLSLVSEKLLVTFRNSFTQQFAFAWLDDSGKTSFWDEKATQYKLAGNNMYYASYDSSASQWALRVYDGAHHTLATRAGEPVNALAVEQQNGYEYISVDAGFSERLLVVANADRKESVRIYPWNRGPAPALLRDKAGSLFLIADGTYVPTNATLKVAKVIQGNQWEMLADITGSQIYANTPKDFNEGPFHTSFAIEGDQLFFTSLFGYESVYASYLGVFNFKKNTKRVSAQLPKAVTARAADIRAVTDDVFEIVANQVKCNYNLSSNEPGAIVSVPADHARVKVGNLEYSFEDNLYIATKGPRLPLLSTSPVYVQQGLYRAVLNNKLIFLSSNAEKGTSKLWVSDGKTTTELLDFEGIADSWRLATDSTRVGNHMVLSSYTEKAIRIIKTDGTKQGTKVIYTYSGNAPASVSNTKTNARMAAFELNVNGKRRYLVTDLEQTWEIDASAFEYHGLVANDSDFFLVHSSVKNGMAYDVVFRIVEGKLQRIELSKNGPDAVYPTIANGRFYFGLRKSAGQLYDVAYTEANSETVNRIYTGPLNYLILRGDYLLANTGTGVNVYKASNAKLLGEFADIHPTQTFSGPAIGLWGTRKAIFVLNDKITTQTFTQDIVTLLDVPSGILVKLNGTSNTFSWYLFDRKTGGVSELFKDQAVDYMASGPDGQLLFSATAPDLHCIIWDTSRQKRITLPTGYQVNALLPGSLALLSKVSNFDQQYVFETKGEKAVEKYAIKGWHDAFYTDREGFLSIEDAGRGHELARIDADSLYHFPEIIRGPEGITLHQVFRFQGSDYATAFTFSKGLQVWKMDEKSLTPGDEVVIEKPELPGRGGFLPDDMVFNTYPNPVINELNIDLREAGMIKVIDQKGLEILKTAAGRNNKLDMKHLPAGQYMIIYSGKSGNVVKKVVKL